jgi:hypothetical protein
VSHDLDPGTVSPSPARGIAGQVVANTSLLIAVLVYMGWAYENALYGYFHVSPLDLNVGIVEYMLRSLTLFSPGVAVAAVIAVAVSAARTWGLERTRLARSAVDKATARVSMVPAFRRLVPAGDGRQSRAVQLLLIGAGLVVTGIALVLAFSASLIPVSTYVVLGLLAAGPLLLTWPTRADRRGRFPYSLAIVITAVCALWAAALYAQATGIREAQAYVHNLRSQTAVVVYSMQRLALSGPGVTVQQLSAGFRYHYSYQGLRLLTTRSGTYYLLPVRWNRQHDLTYILGDDDQIRIVLLSGVARPEG